MKNKKLNLNDIKKLIPHRGPMLLIDKVTSIEPFVSATGIKSIKENESFFQGHFPKKPIMPGIFIVEALAQTASILVMHSLNLTSDNKYVVILVYTYWWKYCLLFHEEVYYQSLNLLAF